MSAPFTWCVEGLRAELRYQAARGGEVPEQVSGNL